MCCSQTTALGSIVNELVSLLQRTGNSALVSLNKGSCIHDCVVFGSVSFAYTLSCVDYARWPWLSCLCSCAAETMQWWTLMYSYMCVCGGTVLVCSITKPSSTNPRFTPVRLRITVNLPPNKITAGCTRDWWPCSRAKYSTQSALCHGIVRAS